jgi:hypothetical protein
MSSLFFTLVSMPRKETVNGTGLYDVMRTESPSSHGQTDDDACHPQMTGHAGQVSACS